VISVIDTLTYGFVRMALALIVVDEAHHCIRWHAANKITQDYCHRTRVKFGQDVVPRILGTLFKD